MDTYRKSRGHKAKVFTERYFTNIRKRFYSVKVAHGWNHLPKDVVEAKSLN